VVVSAPSERNLGKWREAGAQTTHENGTAITNAKVVILAMKPQQFQGPWQGPKDLGGRTLFISVMAGISTSALERGLVSKGCGQQVPVVRTMPNTPIMVGQGATVLCSGQFATVQDVNTAKLIFGGKICKKYNLPL